MRSSRKKSLLSVSILSLTLVFSLAASTRNIAKDVWLAIPPNDSEDTSCNDDTFGLFDDLFLGETYRDDYGANTGPVMMLSSLESLSGMKIWTKNSHVSDTGGYDASAPLGEFGHYNPAFVRWAFTVFLPARQDSSFRRKTQSRYDGCVSPFTRMAWATLQVIKSNPGCRDQLVQQYRSDSNPRKRAPTAYTWEEQCTSDASSEVFYSLEELVGHPDDLTIGHLDGASRVYPAFWLRREIDGSRAAFEAGLKRLLQVYDAKWLRRYGAKAAHRPLPEEREGQGTRSDKWRSAQSQLVSQARQRLRAPMLAEAKRVREARVETALATCAKFQAEVAKRRSEIRAFARAGRDATAQGALRDLEAWISQQQNAPDGMGSALETLRTAMDELDRQAGSNGVTMATKVRFAKRVQRACSP